MSILSIYMKYIPKLQLPATEHIAASYIGCPDQTIGFRRERKTPNPQISYCRNSTSNPSNNNTTPPINIITMVFRLRPLRCRVNESPQSFAWAAIRRSQPKDLRWGFIIINKITGKLILFYSSSCFQRIARPKQKMVAKTTSIVDSGCPNNTNRLTTQY